MCTSGFKVFEKFFDFLLSYYFIFASVKYFQIMNMLSEALLKIPLRCLHYPDLRAVNRPQNFLVTGGFWYALFRVKTST
jgi:hypothetical protein